VRERETEEEAETETRRENGDRQGCCNATSERRDGACRIYERGLWSSLDVRESYGKGRSDSDGRVVVAFCSLAIAVDRRGESRA